MKRYLPHICAAALYFFPLAAFAQPTIKKWDKSFGNKTKLTEGYVDPFKVIKTRDGNYLMVSSASFDAEEDKSRQGLNDDTWLIKFRPDGTKLWEQTLVEPGSYVGTPDVIATSDGGYLACSVGSIAAGGDKTAPGIGRFDYWIVKLDSLGSIQWDRTVGGFGRDIPAALQESADGGFLIAGSSESGAGGDKSSVSRGVEDYWLVKINAAGQKEWDYTYGGTGIETLVSLVDTKDGGYLLAGTSDSPVSGDKSEESTDMDFWLVKINSDGTKQWEKTIGGNGEDRLSHVYSEPDGGFLLSGSSISNAGRDKTENSRGFFDAWVVKVDSVGQVVWDKTLGGTRNDQFSYAQNSLDGGYLLGGYSSSPAGGDKTEGLKEHVDSDHQGDFWLVKLDASHQKVWDRTIGGDGPDGLAYVNEFAPGKYFMLGGSSSLLWRPQDRSVQRKGWSDAWFMEFWENDEPPLPVVLTSFDVTPENSAALVRWRTSAEVNAAYFEIQHSTHAKDWTRIATIEAQANTAVENAYQFYHNNPSGRDHFYRLKMVDHDGTFTLSRTVHVRFDWASDVAIYPNPVSGTMHFHAQDWSQVANIRMYGSQGNVVYDAGQKPAKSVNTISFAPGFYFIKITLADGSSTIKKVVVGL